MLITQTLGAPLAKCMVPCVIVSITGIIPDSWPKVGTLARRLCIAERTVQRGLEELILEGWIGTPCGDMGGARQGILYHLHSDGKPCLFCVAAARTINQRRKQLNGILTGDRLTPQRRTGAAVTPLVATGDKCSPLQAARNPTEVSSTGDKSAPVPEATGDIVAARGDKSDGAYRQRRSLMTSSKSSTSSAEVPIEFAELMNQEPTLDRGALLRLWRTTHEILPDPTAEEIRHFFHDRAVSVYRNRRLENPTGLMPGDHPRPVRATTGDGERREIQQADVTFEVIRAELGEMGIIPGRNNEEPSRRGIVEAIPEQTAQAGKEKASRDTGRSESPSLCLLKSKSFTVSITAIAVVSWEFIA